MSSKIEFSRGSVSRAFGTSILAAILFVAGCSTNSKTAAFAVTTTSSELTASVSNTAYAGATLTAANGTAPYTWAITAGNLPAGLTLSATGVISGTVTVTDTPGAYPFTVEATDSAVPPHTAMASLTLDVDQAPAITSGTSTTFTVGSLGTFTATATGFPAPTFTESGALPTGVTLNATTGVLTGTPAAGTGRVYAITITALNGIGTNATQSFALTVDQAPAITSQNAIGFGAGVPATFTVTTTGFPAPTLAEMGSLPTGVTFVPATGVLSGTTSSQGSYPIVFTSTNGIGTSATQNFTFIVGVAPAITSGNSATFTVGTPGTFTMTATGSPAPTFTEVGALPAGVTLNATTGVLSGTPTAGTGGSYPITVTASNTVIPSATQAFTLTVDQSPAITSQASTTFTLGSTGTFPVIATGYPIVALSETGALPGGVTFVDNGNNTATLSGIATGSASTYPITINGTNGISPDASQSFTLTTSAASTCPTGGNLGLLNGQYAFGLKGFDVSGNPVLLGGVFTANGSGVLTAGTVDMTLVDGMHTALALTAGSYTIGSTDNQGCLVITTAQEGTQNYRISLGTIGGITAGVASNGYMIDFDASGPFTSGAIRQQSPSAFSNAAIDGNWTFGAAAIQNSAQGAGKFSCIGDLSLSAGTISGGAEDCNRTVTTPSTTTTIDFSGAANLFPTNPVAINSGGTYNIGTNGRGTLSYTPSGQSAISAFVYVVSATEMLVMSNQAEASGLIFAGEAYHQITGPFTSANLSGTSILYADGLGSTAGGSDITLGILTTTGVAGTYTFSGYDNDSGNTTDPTNNNGAGNFTVASNGRVMITSGGSGNHQPDIWMINTDVGFILESDQKAEIGFVAHQSSVTSPNGTYAIGSVNPQAPGNSDSEAIVMFNSALTTIAVTEDQNVQGSLTAASTASTNYSYNATTGVGMIPSGCTLTGVSANCQLLFIVTSPTTAYVMDVNPTTMVSPQINPGLSFAAQ